MAAQRRGGLQNSVLNRLRKTRVQTTVHLINGVRLKGTIAAFDEFCIWLSAPAGQQLVFKHAISTILPQKPIRLSEPGEPEGPEEAAEAPAE